MSSIGVSERTYGKHVLLHKILGREVGLLSRKRPRFINNRYVMIDMCAGDGKKTYQSLRSSPEIMSYHLNYLRRMCPDIRADLILIEKDRNTFDLLKTCGFPARLYHCDAAIFSKIPVDCSDSAAAFVHIDPNHINHWPITEEFAKNLPKYSTMLITLGCNVGGLKRLPLESRRLWFDKMGLILDRLPSWHDAMLVALKNDSKQWAYLVTGPLRWHEQGRYEKDAASAFSYWHHGIETVRYKHDPKEFHRTVNRLFLTKEEFDNA